jgi:hypothetical protein
VSSTPPSSISTERPTHRRSGTAARAALLPTQGHTSLEQSDASSSDADLCQESSSSSGRIGTFDLGSNRSDSGNKDAGKHDSGSFGDMPTMLQSFLRKLDNIEQGLKQDWETEQHQREAELQHMPKPCLRRSLSGGLPSSVDLLGPSLPLSNPDDIVAENRSGMRSARVGLYAAHSLIPSRDWHSPSGSSPLAVYQLPACMPYDAVLPEGMEGQPVWEGTLENEPLARSRQAAPSSTGSTTADAKSSAAVAAALAAVQKQAEALEELVGERMEPIARHIAGMKRRMISAQEEAQELRLEMENLLKSNCTASSGESEAMV